MDTLCIIDDGHMTVCRPYDYLDDIYNIVAAIEVVDDSIMNIDKLDTMINKLFAFENFIRVQVHTIGWNTETRQFILECKQVRSIKSHARIIHYIG